MSRYAIKFPFRVRIHGGEFDESARAIHREDGLKTIQAESGIVLESTIERKQMSTKTTFKRIALVTVAALGFGVMSVAPSNAAADSMTLGAATSSATVGVAVSNTVTLSAIAGGAGETLTATVLLISAPSTSANAAVLPGTVTPTWSSGTSNTDTNTVGSAASAAVLNVLAKAAGRYTAAGKIEVTPDVAGTYVYSITPGGAALNKTAQTWTVTATAQTVNNVTNFISTTTGSAATVDTVSTSLSASSSANLVEVARLTSSQYRSTDTATLVANTSALGVSVSISGAGALGTTPSGARGPSVSFSAATNAVNDVYVFADGRSGTATITTTIGTFTSTKTFRFVGSLATMSATASKKNLGVGETMTITAAGADSVGTATAAPTVTATTSDATVATVSAASAVATVTGVKAGTATITLTSGTITTTSVVTVLPVTAKTLAWEFDKDAYEAGEKMTLKITASGVADGARAAFVAAPTANFQLSSGSSVLEASPTFASGVATYTLYAPATPGKFTLTASVGLAIDTEIAIKAAATSYTASVATISVNVTNPALVAAQEATDAANEATDAGNNAKDAADQAIEAADAATIAAQDAAAAAEAAGEMAVEAAEAAGAIAQDALDAANAATDAALSAAEAADAATAAATEAKESADAATAAVAALSAEVAKLMAALTAKVTTLSTLVAKIAKKVKA